jgi:predicted MPP superfamily phosphohydrolase
MRCSGFAVAKRNKMVARAEPARVTFLCHTPLIFRFPISAKIEMMVTSVSTPVSPVTRRGFMKGALGAVTGLALYGCEIERHFIQIHQSSVRIPGLAPAFDGMRIAQLSDIHLDQYTEPVFLRHALRLIDGLNPDAVFLTGDFVTSGLLSTKFAGNAGWQCAEILSELKCAQRYAVLGNHDFDMGAKKITAALTANRITVLNNASLPIERNGARFWLAGVEDPLQGNPDPDLAIPAPIRNLPGEPVLLLCHAPDYADDLLAYPSGKAVSLMLSGHTHGGQVRLPFIGPLTLPPLGKKYVEGWFRLDNLQLHVNRGLGTVGVPVRFDCPPEISLLTLRAA